VETAQPTRRVLLAAPRGYCAGVDRAVQSVERALALWGAPVYVRKQIVHNSHVVRVLNDLGAVVVDEVDQVPIGGVVVFSAHGVSPRVREIADDRGLKVVDATCPLVAKVHREARRFAAEGLPIVLIGHAGHEEVEGTTGEAPANIHVVAGPDDVAGLDLPTDRPVAWLSQTTLSVDEAQATVARLRGRYAGLVDPPSQDICYATQNRQAAVRELARRCDVVIVVGSANSSNSVRLTEVARDAGAGAAQRVDDASGLMREWFDDVVSIGVSSGASVPEDLVRGVLDRLVGWGWPPAEEVRLVDETLRFALPPQLRES
jgi:4-hydroxy-3-methylbut-2-enyl diphosphate reductase